MSSIIDVLVEMIEEWLLSIMKKRRYVNPNLDPVLLVPGIAGSILTAVDEKGRKERVWVRILGADHEFRKKLWSLYNPSNGKSESLDPKTHIEVPQERFGLYACDTLDPDMLLGANTVAYFHDMIEVMLSWGYDEGKTLFGFGYDFRQSNRLKETFEKLIEKLEYINKAANGKKINIITHSMGGILIKCFAAVHKEIFEKYVNSWIAIAAPFQGAPGYITDALFDGCTFCHGWTEKFFVSKWSMHQLVVECPSIYELMACPDFKWSSPPLLEIWHQKKDEDGQLTVASDSFGPRSSVAVMKAALANNSVSYNGTTIPLPFNSEIYKWSNETRKILLSATLPESVKFYNIYGIQNDTPFSVCYGSKDNPLGCLEEILHSEATYTYVDGDGTVPAESAMADGFRAEERIGVATDHRGIVCDEHVFNIIKSWLKIGDPDPFYDPVSDYVILPTKAEFVEFIEKFNGLRSDNWEVISQNDVDNGESELVQLGCAMSSTAEQSATIDFESCWSIIENHIGDLNVESTRKDEGKRVLCALNKVVLEASMGVACENTMMEGFHPIIKVTAP